MAREKPLGRTDLVKETPELRRGGFHSRGVPGEEGLVRAHMRVLKLSDQNQTINAASPAKGGPAAESTSTGRLEAAAASGAGGHRALYVLARQGADQLETPVFRAGETGDEESVAVFTDRNKALLYLQTAGWDRSHEPADLSPSDLGRWLQEARAEGIDLVAVDLDRQAHLRGETQHVLFLKEQVDQSGDALYRELRALGGA